MDDRKPPHLLVRLKEWRSAPLDPVRENAQVYGLRRWLQQTPLTASLRGVSVFGATFVFAFAFKGYASALEEMQSLTIAACAFVGVEAVYLAWCVVMAPLHQRDAMRVKLAIAEAKVQTYEAVQAKAADASESRRSSAVKKLREYQAAAAHFIDTMPDEQAMKAPHWREEAGRFLTMFDVRIRGLKLPPSVEALAMSPAVASSRDLSRRSAGASRPGYLLPELALREQGLLEAIAALESDD